MTSISVIAGAAFLPGGSLRTALWNSTGSVAGQPPPNRSACSSSRCTSAGLRRASSHTVVPRVRNGGASYLEIESLLFELLEHRLVELLQLRQRELRREQ